MFNNSSSGFPSQNRSFTTDGKCQYSGNSTAETAVKVLAYVAILLISLVGNALVIMVTYKDKRLRKSINFFVLNMAVSDLFTPLTIMPIRIVQIISGSNAFKVNSPLILGEILCKLCYFLPDVSFVVSVETLLLLSMDRFIAVVFPLKRMVISSKARLICILCTWVFSIAVHAPYLYTFTLSSVENETMCLRDWGEATKKRYVTATFITFIIIPICILAIVYGTIAWTLKRRYQQRKMMSSNCGSHIHKMNKQIIRLSVAIMLSFIVCVVPLLVLGITHIFFRIPPKFCAFGTVIAFLARFMVPTWSATNPCICFIFNKNYRMGLNHALSGQDSSIRMQAEAPRGRKPVSIISTQDIHLLSFRTV